MFGLTPDRLTLLSVIHIAGRYLDELEDIDNGQHQAVINAFASTASFFWPSNATGSSTHSPLLDLSIFHSLFKKLNGNKRAEDASGNVVQHLLRSLHVALNEGEYCSDQPTYSRTPLKLDAAGDENETAMRNHVDQLRNMQAIQEDSIVKDLFEGLVCMTSRCMACHGVSVALLHEGSLLLTSIRFVLDHCFVRVVPCLAGPETQAALHHPYGAVGGLREAIDINQPILRDMPHQATFR